MRNNGSNSQPAIGFLTVLSHAELGLTGGYLVLNTLGRPIEFHCTAPVKTNRTQEILYGATLKEFLYGEQIGQTLLEKSQVQPLLVCTDVYAALSVRDVSTIPVALVLPPDGGDEAPRQEAFPLGGCELMVSSRHAADRQQIIDRWGPYADEFNLLEPFERIREAIVEAQKAA